MFLFVLFLLLAAIGYFDVARQGRQWYGVTFKAFYILLALLPAFRYGVGIDTITYMATFNSMPTLSEMTLLTFVTYRFQPLFTITCIACKTLWDNFLLLQLLQTALFFPSFYLLLKLFRVRKFYLLFVFYSYMYFSPGMSAMREGFALAFCFYAVYLYYQKRNYFVYYLLVVIGVFFHTGAVLFLLLPFFSLFRQNTTRNFLLFCSAVFLFTLVAGVLQNVLGDSLGGDGSVQRYKLNGEEATGSLFTVVRSLAEIALTYYICVLHPPKKGAAPTSVLYLGVSYLILDLLSAVLSPMLFRFSSHLCIYHLFCVKYILEDKRVREVLLYAALVLFFYQPLARVMFLFTDSVGDFNYYTVFSSDKSHTDRRVATADTHDYILSVSQ